MITSDFSKSVRIGSQAPGFALRATDGTTVTLSEQKGPAVVFFTCNHCPYVVGWERRVHGLIAELGDGVRWFGINANDAGRYPEDGFERMAERARKGLPYTYLHDPTQEVAHAYGAQVTPEFFVLDDGHRVVYHGRLDESHADPNAAGTPFLRNALLAMSAGQAPHPAETSVEGCSIKWFV